MFRQSIKRKIVGIAIGLIVLAVITSALSMVLAGRVGHLLDELTNRYIPAYSHLTRVNTRSLERALALRRMVLAKMQNPPDDAGYAARLKAFEEKDSEIDQEAQAARKLIIAIIEDASTPSDNAALARIDNRIDTAVNDLRHAWGKKMHNCFGSLMRGISRKSEIPSNEPTRSATNSIKSSIPFALTCWRRSMRAPRRLCVISNERY